ncbi:MAG: methyltransferase domain-containing protein [bacterium]
MADVNSGVVAHYGSADMAARILAAAAEAGITEITPATLAPVDEFHTGGLPATRELAKFAGLQPGDRVIDLGSGIGGPARIMASEFDCRVTGIDLTPEFVETATALTERCGLSDRARFQVADALALPFEDSLFDVAWTQHVVMNIRDRQAFYSEAARVLKPGGKFVFFDLLLGNGQPLEYPLPWARTPDISFLYTVEDTRNLIGGAGLVEENWFELQQAAAPMLQQQAAMAAPGVFSLALVMGEDMGARVGNVARAVADGRITVVRGLFRKPA